MRTFRWSVVSLMLLAGQSAAQAERAQDAAALDGDAEPTRWRLRILHDNDGSFLRIGDNDGDRWYTSGTRVDLQFNGGIVDRAAPGWEWLRSGSLGAGVALGQRINTPEDTDRVNPDPDDRPYAGWLYLGLYLQREREHSGRLASLDHFELDLGVTGEWSLAEEAQDFIHSVLGIDKARGWDSQIATEFAVNANYRRVWRAELVERSAEGFGAQVLPEISFDLGNVWRRARGGATIRAGFNLPDDFGPSRIDAIGSFTSAPTDGFSAYLFARGGFSLVQHDTFIDGSDFLDGPGVNSRPAVAEGQIGAAVRFGPHVELSYALTYLTEEFFGQGEDNHSYMTISLLVELPF